MGALEKAGVSFILLGLVFGLGMFAGDLKATKKYLPRIASLQSAIDAADAMAKEDKRISDENLKAAEKGAANRRNSLERYYNRMLQQRAEGGSPAAGKTENPETHDAGIQRGLSGCPIEVERNFVRDFESLREFHDIAIRNGWQIIED